MPLQHVGSMFDTGGGSGQLNPKTIEELMAMLGGGGMGGGIGGLNASLPFFPGGRSRGGLTGGQIGGLFPGSGGGTTRDRQNQTQTSNSLFPRQNDQFFPNLTTAPSASGGVGFVGLPGAT